MATRQTADRWRRLLAPGAATALEGTDAGEDPKQRVRRAREVLEKLIRDRFGADPALLQAAGEIELSATKAVQMLLEDADSVPSDDELGALEAIVTFDGTRPSFLVKQNDIDFDSSLNTGKWESDLQPLRPSLAARIASTGRVELGETHIGTAFLVTPTLVVTNRHVAQAIATFANRQVTLRTGVFLDFGREEWNSRMSLDRRTVEAVTFAGDSAIAGQIDHRKLDLAVLRVSKSTLTGQLGQRHLAIQRTDAAAYQAVPFIATVGYPGDPETFAPVAIQTKFAGVLKQLLEGDGGAKRFAPGVPAELVGVPADLHWTVCHDTTTINGNSGSPLLALSGQDGDVTLVGLHYGGRWGGERVNWGHLLSAVGGGTDYATGATFESYCNSEGISF
jgi:serine protease